VRAAPGGRGGGGACAPGCGEGVAAQAEGSLAMSPAEKWGTARVPGSSPPCCPTGRVTSCSGSAASGSTRSARYAAPPRSPSARRPRTRRPPTPPTPAAPAGSSPCKRSALSLLLLAFPPTIGLWHGLIQVSSNRSLLVHAACITG
jgi:hypothetical protein